MATPGPLQTQTHPSCSLRSFLHHPCPAPSGLHSYGGSHETPLGFHCSLGPQNRHQMLTSCQTVAPSLLLQIFPAPRAPPRPHLVWIFPSLHPSESSLVTQDFLPFQMRFLNLTAASCDVHDLICTVIHPMSGGYSWSNFHKS